MVQQALQMLVAQGEYIFINGMYQRDLRLLTLQLTYHPEIILLMFQIKWMTLDTTIIVLEPNSDIGFVSQDSISNG